MFRLFYTKTIFFNYRQTNIILKLTFMRFFLEKHFCISVNQMNNDKAHSLIELNIIMLTFSKFIPNFTL